MAYHLKRGEPVPAGIRRIVREELESAARQLSGEGDADRDTAIHEARKSLKKIRGALRLMRPEVESIYRLENAWLRGVGLRLSHYRDAGAMMETFDALRERYQGELERRKLAGVRRGLLARKRQVEAEANIDGLLRRMAGSLRRRLRRVDEWPLEAEGFEAIAPGLEARFRRGRRALRRVREEATAENYHEWRKRVKDHWYHVRLLESYWDARMAAYERRLKELETWLGDDHNLVVMEAKIAAEPGFYGSAAEVAILVRLLGAYHQELRGKALALGERMYAQKPREFVRRAQHLWDGDEVSEDAPAEAAVMRQAAG